MTLLKPKTRYSVRTSRDPEDIAAAQRLRYEVFNVELGEGLETSHATQRDADPFDDHCEHLLIETEDTGEIIGTYRLQTGQMAADGIGYYSEQEFDFAPFEPYRSEVLELGRACIHADHRHRFILNLLWRGIAQYAVTTRSRYLLGCSSLTSQDPNEGWALYEKLQATHLAPEPFRTDPTEDYLLPPASGEFPGVKCPKLFSTYLHIGATIAGPPALDREFQTIDFLTILDLEAMKKAGKLHFLKDRG